MVEVSPTQDSLLLLQDVLSHVASSALTLPLGEPGSEPKRPFNLATSFYGVTPCRELSQQMRKPQVIVTSAEDLFSFTLSCIGASESLASCESSASLSRAMKILTEALAKVSQKYKGRISVAWDAEKWRDATLSYVEKVS